MDLKELEDIPPWEWGEESGTTIRKVLADAQAEVSDRILAAEFATEFTVLCDELAETLLTVVESNDEPAELRGKAAISLGPALEYCDTMEFEDPEDDPISEEVFKKIQHSLKKLYEDPALPGSHPARGGHLGSGSHLARDRRPGPHLALHSPGRRVARGSGTGSTWTSASRIGSSDSRRRSLTPWASACPSRTVSSPSTST